MSHTNIPRFIQIANDLENQIVDGYYDSGDPLPTFKELAEKYDVSIVTVNQSIKELHARGRVVRKRGKGVFVGSKEHNKENSYLIGLIVPDISNPYFSLLAKIIQKRLFAVGYALIIQSSDGNPAKMNGCLRQLMDRYIDGIMLVPLEINLPEHEEVLWKLKIQRIPFLYLNDQITRIPSDYSGIDLQKGMELITQHLIGLKHTNIGCVSAEPYIHITTKKVNALSDSLQNAGLALDSDNVIISDKYHEEGGFEAGIKLIQRKKRPTAIVATSDIIAVGVIKAAKSLGVKVPDELSVVGVDDIDIARITDPPLTTVKQPVEAMAEKAVDIIIKRIEGKLSPDFKNDVFDPELIIRNSTKSR